MWIKAAQQGCNKDSYVYSILIDIKVNVSQLIKVLSANSVDLYMPR